MRIGHINLSKCIRGGEYQTIELIKALGERYEQSAIVRQGAPLADCLEEYPWLRVRRVSGPLPAVKRSRGFDVLHAHEGRGVQVGAVRSLLSGTPFVVTRRVLTPPSDRRVTRWCYSRAARIATVSDAVGESLRRYDAALPVETVYDCARKLPSDSAATKKIRDRCGDTVVFGHVGELDDAVKGQSTIIEAARRSLTRNPKALFCLIGRGKDAELLRKKAHGLPNVYFVDWTRDVGNVYNAMDVFLFPSRNEGLGSAVLEAMSFGLPILAARVGGVPEIVQHGSNGFLIEPGDPEGLSHFIGKLTSSAQLRRKMGDASRAGVAPFSALSMSAAYEHIYECAAGSPVFQTGDRTCDIRKL